MGRFLLIMFFYTGFAAVLRFVHRHELTILLYHGVAPQKGPGIYNYRGKFIAPKHFERQVHYFRRHYTILGLDDAISRMETGTLPPYSLVITFDDGYRNFYTHAFPILKDIGVPATMFLATDFVLGKKPLWVDRLEYATGMRSESSAEKIRLDIRLRNELKKLSTDEREARLQSFEKESGAALTDFSGDRAVYAPLAHEEILEMADHSITYGAHTKSHPILSLESTECVRSEISGSKEALESEGVTLSGVFAYPNGQPGDWNDTVERVLEEGRFTHALTTLEGTNTKDTKRYRLRRMVMDMSDDTPAFAAIASGVRLFLKSLKKYAKRSNVFQ